MTVCEVYLCLLNVGIIIINGWASADEIEAMEFQEEMVELESVEEY